MARKPRIEIEGGLYHVITRGNDRRDIFHSDDDHRKFLSLLTDQKGRMPFYLYAYCLMSNHVHLLIERRADAVGRIMHRLLTGYSQYYNWRYRRSGHLLEGRHKAILCQNEVYMGVLSEISGLNSSNISRRHDTALRRMGEDEHLRKTTEKVVNEYRIQR